MGKVRDEVPASKASKPGKARAGSAPARSSSPGSWPTCSAADLYKPMQGWYARLYTAARRWADRRCRGLAALPGRGRVPPLLAVRRADASFAVVLGWLIFRIVQFPPFVEFLIATEAEMNKVSWTTKDDLIRATTVVLMTVVLMAVFLFVVDRLWSFILQMIGVLQFGGGGGFGSTA